jgi:hypothetical protein
MQVWRKLRSLGALYLQQPVCLLPARVGSTQMLSSGAASPVRSPAGSVLS